MEEKKQVKPKKSSAKWYFLSVVVSAYLPVYFISSDKAGLIFNFFIKLLWQILPVFLLVYVIMLLTNYFIDNKTLQRLMGEEAGGKGWVISIITGIISAGPVYAWYPLMKDLQTKGIKDKFLATFLYNRGIKLQWAPMLIALFGWKYSVTLLIVMGALSVPQGIITGKLVNSKTA